jgi:hypothetical protein
MAIYMPECCLFRKETSCMDVGSRMTARASKHLEMVSIRHSNAITPDYPVKPRLERGKGSCPFFYSLMMPLQALPYVDR